MKEAYMFRYATLQTMNSLIETHSTGLQEKILTRGLDVLFSEPDAKGNDTVKDNQFIITELISMVKAQIPKV